MPCCLSLSSLSLLAPHAPRYHHFSIPKIRNPRKPYIKFSISDKPPPTKPTKNSSWVSPDWLTTLTRTLSIGGQDDDSNTTIANAKLEDVSDLLGGGALFLPLFQWVNEYGPIYRLAAGTRNLVAKHVLRNYGTNKYAKKGLVAEVSEFLFGSGFAIAEGSLWTEYVACSRYYATSVSKKSDASSSSSDDDDDDSFSSEIEDIETEIEKIDKNSRRIQSMVAVDASLETVWSILTDYERLVDFIPSLAVSEVLDKRDNFARLLQVGEQNLAFGLKFKAQGVVDCYEKALEILPLGQRRREIEFEMIEGDFRLFKGKWSIQQLSTGTQELPGSLSRGGGFRTTLSYVVDVEPKMWLPVQLVESRLSREIKINLSSIRKAAHKAVGNDIPLAD